MGACLGLAKGRDLSALKCGEDEAELRPPLACANQIVFGVLLGHPGGPFWQGKDHLHQIEAGLSIKLIAFRFDH
jgi:hypothetical protein